MKKTTGSGRSDPRPLGPLPAEPASATGPMSRARSGVLETLRAEPGPVTLAALSKATGLHVNTLRGHLEALEERGLVERTQAPPSGRGRPALRYRATEHAGGSEYAGLAATLAATIHRTSPSPREDAVAAGTEWGRDLAHRGRRPTSSGDRATRRAVVDLLDGLGFGPRADRSTTTVRLTRCPLLEAAQRFPDVVCGVHLGIVRGALEEYGADGEGADLHPFSHPGACLLELGKGSS